MTRPSPWVDHPHSSDMFHHNSIRGRRRRVAALIRRIVAAVCFVGLSAADSSAFKLDYHVEMTQEALAMFVKTLPANAGELLAGFSTDAIREIVAANKAKDTDCGVAGYHTDVNMPATECTFGTETVQAIAYLTRQPAPDHFDAEKIQEGSDQIFDAVGQIREYLLNGQFVAARRVLGGALHGIQDFYSHSNWVELGKTDYERRLGASRGAFANGTPRVARPNEPTCVGGDRLLTSLTGKEQQELLLKLEKLRLGEWTDKFLLDLLVEKPLTSGYFTFLDTPPEIDLGKCRHGYQVKDIVGQTGINKDEPVFGVRYENARLLARGHSVNFIVQLFNDPVLRKDPDALLGFMGRGLMEGVTVGVPGAPNNESWDTALGSALRFFVEGTRGLKNIQPDILVCLQSRSLRPTCVAVCDDADWSIESEAYVCNGNIRVPLEPVDVSVREVDLGQPRRLIANFRVEDPTECNSSYSARVGYTQRAIDSPRGTLPVATPNAGACRLELEPSRTIWIQFQTRRAPGMPPPPLPRVPGAPPPEIVGPRIPDDPRRDDPGNPVPPAPVPPGPVPPAPPPPPPPPPPPRPSPAEIADTLNLRDEGNCTAGDAFFPRGTAFIGSDLGRRLGPEQADRLFQMAAFTIAISDPTAKKALLDEMRSRVGDEAFYGVMTLVIGDLNQSRAVLSAYQRLANDIIDRLVSAGLDRLLPAPRSPRLVVADVDRWILKRLAGPLVPRALDMMSMGMPPITAECTLNQLAQEGFIETVNGARTSVR